jgi:hypothetical protein
MPYLTSRVTNILGCVALFALVATGGCATVPAEAVAAQQLVKKNIEVARQKLVRAARVSA